MNIGGKKISNGWLIGGGLGLAAAFLIYRHFSSASSASSSASASTIDPVTGLPASEDNQVDPATGLTYLAEAQEYGSVQAAETMISSGSAYFGQPGTGGVLDAGYPTYYPGQGSTPNTGSYSTNAAWAQAVTSGLAGLGYDSGTVSAALGAFFAQMPLTSSQASIIQAAEAEFGPPPQGTYSIIPEPSSGGSVNNTFSVPNVTGVATQQAITTLKAAGFATVNVNGPQTGVVWSQTPAAGAQATAGGSIDIASSASGKPPEVPQVTGSTVQAAESALTAAGYRYSLNGPATGKIWSQTPAGGAIFGPGGTVDIASSATGKPPAGV